MIQIRAIGKLKTNTPEFALIADYLKKMREKVEIHEYVEKKNLTEDYFKDLIVVSYNEVESDVELQSVGMVTA